MIGKLSRGFKGNMWIQHIPHTKSYKIDVKRNKRTLRARIFRRQKGAFRSLTLLTPSVIVSGIRSFLGLCVSTRDNEIPEPMRVRSRCKSPVKGALH